MAAGKARLEGVRPHEPGLGPAVENAPNGGRRSVHASPFGQRPSSPAASVDPSPAEAKGPAGRGAESRRKQFQRRQFRRRRALEHHPIILAQPSSTKGSALIAQPRRRSAKDRASSTSAPLGLDRPCGPMDSRRSGDWRGGSGQVACGQGRTLCRRTASPYRRVR